MNKLPQITIAFWIMKICATTLGETAGDLLSMTLKLYNDILLVSHEEYGLLSMRINECIKFHY